MTAAEKAYSRLRAGAGGCVNGRSDSVAASRRGVPRG